MLHFDGGGVGAASAAAVVFVIQRVPVCDSPRGASSSLAAPFVREFKDGGGEGFRSSPSV